MILAMLTVKMRAGMADEAARLYNAEIMPLLRQQGVQHAYLALDETDQTAVEMLLWETREQCDLSVNSPERRAVVARLAPLFASAPTRQIFEVRSAFSIQQHQEVA